MENQKRNENYNGVEFTHAYTGYYEERRKRTKEKQSDIKKKKKKKESEMYQ